MEGFTSYLELFFLHIPIGMFIFAMMNDTNSEIRNKISDTRTSILYKNYEAIHANGFHATRTDKVISELGITKGAFKHASPT